MGNKDEPAYHGAMASSGSTPQTTTAAGTPSPSAPTARAASAAISSTGYTLLGLLSFGQELSGYELKRWAENLRFFWSAPAMSQVYRELERLTADGLVVPRDVVREGTRSTRVYSLTAAGRRALHTWLTTPPEAPVLRHPVALRVFFGHLLTPDELRTALEAHRAWCDTMLADLASVRERLSDEPLWRNVAMVAEWGLGYYRGERDAVDGIERTLGDSGG